MDKNQLEKLLLQDESSNLDFKSEIDLDSKRGKTDFLVEVLGLANSPDKPAYLILGIEDKTKKVSGIPEDISEERLQKIIADNCRPSIRCVFETAAYKRKKIGILTILGNTRPYTVKKEVGFEDLKGKPQHISDKTVFVRRGSTGDTANPEEIAEMFFERQGNESVPENNEEIYEELDRITTNLSHIDNSINRLTDRGNRDRVVEYLFVGITSGLIIGILQALGLSWQIATFGILLSVLWVSIIGSVLKIIRFGWLRSLIVSIVISGAFIALSYILDEIALQKIVSNNLPFILMSLWGGVKGMVAAVVLAWFGRGEYEYD